MNKHTNNECVWEKAPLEAYHWERFPNGRCIYHCRDANGISFTKKAPNFNIQTNFLWRDLDKQKEAEDVKSGIEAKLKKLNITLIR